MNILLTGATGFTGQHFIACARAAGHTVQPLCCNLTHIEDISKQIQAAVSGWADHHLPWAVVHLAAVSFVGHADALAFYHVNTLGTEHLLSVLSQQTHLPECVLLASSANIYGNCPQSPIAENQPPAPVNHYAVSKLAMEHLALTYANKLPLIISRPFNYTGTGQAHQFVIPKIIEHFIHKKPIIELGNLHVEREYNDVDFICQSYLYLLQYGQKGGIYNICTGVTYTLQYIIDRLVAITGHHIDIQVHPAFVRANEINRLCGDPSRLQKIWQAAQVAWPENSSSLDITLKRMLVSE